MSEKPRKRLVIHSNTGQDKKPPPPPQLVTKGKYAFLLGKSVSLTFLSLSSDFAAIVLLLLAVVQLGGIFYIWPIVTALMTAGLACLFLLAARNLAKKANEIDHIKPITRHNTGHLPAAETLVRASDLPPSDQQAELLRGVGTPSSETPPEELLRMTTNGTMD